MAASTMYSPTYYMLPYICGIIQYKAEITLFGIEMNKWNLIDNNILCDTSSGIKYSHTSNITGISNAKYIKHILMQFLAELHNDKCL